MRTRKRYRVNERFFWTMTLLILAITLTWLITDYNRYMADWEPIQDQGVTTIEEYRKQVEEQSAEPEKVILGEFTVTHYTNSVECCGKTDGITASGTLAKEDHTVAADESIPFGTKIMIEGDDTVYTVEDRGGAIEGNRLDIYVGSMDEAITRGVIERKVFIIN